MVVVDEEQFRALPASLATARAYHAQAIGDVAGTVKYARRVLDLVPEGDHKWRGDATALLGLAYWASGDLEAAHRTLSDGLADMKPLDIIVGTFVLAEMKMMLGHLHEAIRTCEHALQLANEHGEPMPLGTEDVYTAISELHRERGDLKAAAQGLGDSQEAGRASRVTRLAVSLVHCPGSITGDPGRPGWRSRPAGRGGAPVCQDSPP